MEDGCENQDVMLKSDQNSAIVLMESKIATHSKVDPPAITYKFLQSGLLKRLEPSAMFYIILKDSLLSWFFEVGLMPLLDWI